MADGPREAAEYGGKVLKVEPFGIERISENERHGRPWKLFPFWFGANVTLYSFLVGFLGITVFALPVPLAIAGIVLGTVLGTTPFALLSLIGPATGYPQIAHSRSAFGRRGAYLPAALDVPVKRWSSALVGGVIATIFALIGGASGSAFYESWLFFVEYWIAPWAAIVLVSFLVFSPRGTEPPPDRARPWRSSALLAYAVAVLVAVPFMDQPAFLGPASAAMGGLDVSDLISFLAAALLFYLLASREARLSRAAQTTGSGSESTEANP